MKLAIMQPYIFPYIGYFQIINAVDKFVIYDDAAFIKQGWINRNRILMREKDFAFTIPVKNQSSFRLIKDMEIVNSKMWKKKIIKSIEQSYRKAPYFTKTVDIITGVFSSNVKFISQLAWIGIERICGFLDIDTEFVFSSQSYKSAHLKGEARIIDICRREKAKIYINAFGGADLYSKGEFKKNRIELLFLRPNNIEYRQFSDTFIPWLSIIDVMMFNSKEKIKFFLGEYALL